MSQTSLQLTFRKIQMSVGECIPQGVQTHTPDLILASGDRRSQAALTASRVGGACREMVACDAGSRRPWARGPRKPGAHRSGGSGWHAEARAGPRSDRTACSRSALWSATSPSPASPLDGGRGSGEAEKSPGAASNVWGVAYWSWSTRIRGVRRPQPHGPRTPSVSGTLLCLMTKQHHWWGA